MYLSRSLVGPGVSRHEKDPRYDRVMEDSHPTAMYRTASNHWLYRLTWDARRDQTSFGMTTHSTYRMSVLNSLVARAQLILGPFTASISAGHNHRRVDCIQCGYEERSGHAVGAVVAKRERAEREPAV